MDQIAVTLARAGHALLLDCATLEVAHIPLSLPDHAVVVADTASPRRLSTSLYNQRVAECEAALAAIRAVDPSVTGFRQLGPAAIERRHADLPPVLSRRASHVVTENHRVEMAAEALRAGDTGMIGELMVESHESLRHRFEVSSAELDTMVGIALEVPGVAGARMTGAGFGGCAVVLVRRTAVESLRAAVESGYPAVTGLVPRLFEVDAAAGAMSAG
jgi:galactokinase